MFPLELAITPSLGRALLRELSVMMLPRLLAVLQEDKGTVDHTPLFFRELKNSQAQQQSAAATELISTSWFLDLLTTQAPAFMASLIAFSTSPTPTPTSKTLPIPSLQSLSKPSISSLLPS